MLMQHQFIHYFRSLPSAVVETQVVDKDIPHHIHPALFCSLPIGDAVVAHTGGKQQVTQSVDHQTVDLLGHLDVETAGTGN